jgi:hypothetical protein
MQIDSWNTFFGGMGAIATTVYTCVTIMEFRARRKSEHVTALGKEGRAIDVTGGQTTGSVARLNRFIFKGLTFVFAAIGAISVFIIGFVIVGAAVIHAIAPNWNPIDRLQEWIASGVVASIAPHTVVVPRPDPSQPDSISAIPPSGKFSPARTERFIVSLSPATRSVNNIDVKATLRNTTDVPLFLAINNDVRPSLTDDQYGISSQVMAYTGISSTSLNNGGGREKEEQTYTRISPGQALDIGLRFFPYPRGTPQGEGRVHVTVDFLSLSDGKVERVSTSPGGPINSDGQLH